jgi:hypothetical protein
MLLSGYPCGISARGIELQPTVASQFRHEPLIGI